MSDSKDEDGFVLVKKGRKSKLNDVNSRIEGKKMTPVVYSAIQPSKKVLKDSQKDQTTIVLDQISKQM